MTESEEESVYENKVGWYAASLYARYATLE